MNTNIFSTIFSTAFIASAFIVVSVHCTTNNGNRGYDANSTANTLTILPEHNSVRSSSNSNRCDRPHLPPGHRLSRLCRPPTGHSVALRRFPMPLHQRHQFAVASLRTDARGHRQSGGRPVPVQGALYGVHARRCVHVFDELLAHVGQTTVHTE